jgi:hypothetical protein
MNTKNIAPAALIAIFAATAGATTITSTFDTDLDGWTAKNGTVLWSSTGGNPGGFLQEEDTAESNMQVVAPAKFLGDLTGYTFTVDIRQLIGSAGTFGGFGNLTLTGPGGLTMIADFGDPSTSWTTYSLPLTSASFGGNPDFNTIITNVTKIQVALDPRNQENDDQVGLDNVILSNDQADVVGAPEPGSLTLLGAALVACGLWKRKDARKRLSALRGA